MENGGVNVGTRVEKDVIRDKESEMEAALYANCLLLGLDASILGQGPGSRAGLFRHSNPRVGEALLHFLLSALRGPALAAKDFAGVWPIFDAAQSRDFRKIVQGLINELEAQGALPRSSSRVSSLATCCGQRFVELLWQLSAHALREVHRRSFPADVAANPLPASLTEVITQNSHASALLGVTKARIALERRRFLQGAASAVQKQTLWSSLAHDMTAEYRALCAEEAYLHQQLEKAEELKNSRTISSSQMTPGRAAALWESLLKNTEEHEKLASGPIEDLIAHREHRYRIDGAALRSAMDRGINSNMTEDEAIDGHRDVGTDRVVKGSSPVDVAEVIRRWTHALQRIHKQALKLNRQSQGNLISAADVSEGHVQALQGTLLEQKQHLANMQVLINQLKESIPGMEANIAALRQQANPSQATPSSPTLKLPLSSHHDTAGVTSPFSIMQEGDESLDFAASSLVFPEHKDLQDGFGDVSSLRQAVLEAALSKPVEVATEVNTESEHYFTPVTANTGVTKRPQSPPLLVELASFHDDDLLALDMDTALI